MGVLYLLGPNRRSFHPLKLLESTLLVKGFFDLLVDFQIPMVKISCPLLFIEFVGHFWPPFYFFLSSWLLKFTSDFSIGCSSTFLLSVW
jgi:hypothetical protein